MSDTIVAPEEDAADAEGQDSRPPGNPPVAPPQMVAAPAPAAVAPPGVAPVVAPRRFPSYAEYAAPAEDYNRMVQQTSDLPIDKAEAAVAAATKFQAQRGYQRDLANGVSAADALMKWGPTMFGSSAASPLGRLATPHSPKIEHIGQRGYVFDPKNPTAQLKPVTPEVVVAPKVGTFDAQSHSDILREIRRQEAALDKLADPYGPPGAVIRDKLASLHLDEQGIRSRAGAVTVPAGVGSPATAPAAAPTPVRPAAPSKRLRYNLKTGTFEPIQ